MWDKEQAIRNAKYLKWIRRQPSALDFKFNSNGKCEAHHIKGNGFGGSGKCSDILTIPLTTIQHRELHTNGWKTFEDKYNFSQTVECLKLIERAVKEDIL